MGNRLVLSLFPGADLLGRAFELAGFCVVRGPDALLGGDIHDFKPPSGVFEGVIGGPPCQSFSRARWFMGNDRVPAVLATEHKMSAGTKRTNRAGGKLGRRLTLEEVNELMGMPRDWATPALTIEMSYKVRGNGVPVQLGRAIADAVIRATE